MRRLRAWLTVLLLGGCAAPGLTPRPLRLAGVVDGVAYGPHRDGQRPGGAQPSRAEIADDVALLAPRWRLWRVYGADATTAEILAEVRASAPGVRVIVGAWIEPESSPAARAANRAQLEAAIRLARAYPDVVLAISVGNETQVAWSDHRVPAARLVAYVREARARAAVPVTTADDFSWWVLAESAPVARELDFLLVHVHALWNGRTLDEAVAFTRAQHEAVARRHPGRPLVLGEVGWATAASPDGEQGRLIRGAVGEAEQRRYRQELLAWTRAAGVPALFFEAFDEAWKGGADPRDVEKHWGLFRADRTPKAALAGE